MFRPFRAAVKFCNTNILFIDLLSIDKVIFQYLDCHDNAIFSFTHAIYCDGRLALSHHLASFLTRMSYLMQKDWLMHYLLLAICISYN